MNIEIEDAARKANCTVLAAELILSGLAFAVAKKRADGAVTHVDARELCDAIAETAKANHGPGLQATLMKAGIMRSEDIGRIVFSMIEEGLLTKREADSVDDFGAVFETVRL